jgi:ABC-2 type transport system ATP-binding protein
MIEVESLTRVYGNLLAVDGVSFSVKKGEVVGLLGHNGAGKSTIMKMLTGYLEPTAGTIRINGLEMGRDTRAIQAKLGYLPENCPVWPDMTVIDYLAYQADLHAVPRERRDASVARAIRRTALEAKATARIETLSRGYRQRLGVAQAILHDPAIVILDEPTNGLDPTQVQGMRRLIRELAEKATVILSTHVLQEVRAVCERVLIMRGGKLVLDQRLEDLDRAGGLRLVTDRNLEKPLRALQGIRSLHPAAAADGNFTYEIDADATVAPSVARVVHDAGAQLYLLEPRRRDLEAVFAEVNEEVAHAA